MKKSTNEMQSPVKSEGNEIRMVVNLSKTSKCQGKVCNCLRIRSGNISEVLKLSGDSRLGSLYGEISWIFSVFFLDNSEPLP